MKKFKFHRISSSKRLRYIDNYYKKKLFIVFLHGFMSDIEGKKPQKLYKFAKKMRLGFLGLEYSGHGKSSGNFKKGNISIWSRDANKLIKKVVRKNNFVLVGSSMGSWIALNQFKYFKKQIVGMIGIGSAPEFITRLMWNKFSKKTKQEIIFKGSTLITNGEYEYPITYQLVQDGKKNLVLKKKIYSKINVTMIHGKKDEVVPVSLSRLTLNLFKNAKKKLVLVEGGDHSLSKANHLRIIIKELNLIIKNII